MCSSKCYGHRTIYIPLSLMYYKQIQIILRMEMVTFFKSIIIKQMVCFILFTGSSGRADSFKHTRNTTIVSFIFLK